MNSSAPLRLRAILNGDRCIVPAPVYDPMSAVLAETIGYEMGMVGGSSVAASLLAAPDLILITLTELADHIGRMSQASRLPLLIDADHGYGNALNVMRAVTTLATAGAAGMTIEDTELPARWNSPAALVPIGEAVDKIGAALAARQNRDFVIVARTSLKMTKPADVIARAVAYAAAGADAIFLHGASATSDIAAVRVAVGLPLIIGSSATLTPDHLGALYALNVRIALPGHQPLHATIGALESALRSLRDPNAQMPPLATPPLRATVLRHSYFASTSARYLGKPPG